MANWNAWNPFSRRESHSSGSVWVYKILTLVTWLLSVVTSVYYAAKKRHTPHGMPFWDPNHTHPSAFTMSHIMGDVYWGILFVMQFGYVMHLFSRNQEVVNAAASVGSHFILNNLLHFAFVMVFVRGHFIVAELFIVLNFVNLSILYFRHNTSPRFIHGPVASGPLAWTFVAIYWCGAIMIHYQASLAARIVGNVLIWSILVYGLFFIVAFKVRTTTALQRETGTDKTGLHHGLLAQLAVGGDWRRAVPAPDCGAAMDLCVCDYDRAVLVDGDDRRAGLDGQGPSLEALDGQRRRAGATAG